MLERILLVMLLTVLMGCGSGGRSTTLSLPQNDDMEVSEPASGSNGPWTLELLSGGYSVPKGLPIHLTMRLSTSGLEMPDSLVAKVSMLIENTDGAGASWSGPVVFRKAIRLERTVAIAGSEKLYELKNGTVGLEGRVTDAIQSDTLSIGSQRVCVEVELSDSTKLTAVSRVVVIERLRRD